MKKIETTALRYLGYPSIKYKKEMGNDPKNGFDCSGFVQFVLLEMGIKLLNSPTTGELIRHTEEFFDYFGIFIHEEFKNSGDLVFFSRNGIRPSHIGIYLGDNKIIHAPGLDNTNVEIVSLESLCKEIKYDHKKGFQQIYAINPIGFKRPALILNRLHYKKRYQESI